MLRAALRRLENRVMRKLRDPRSAQIFEQPTVPFDARALAGHRYILLVTTRRDGRQTSTPVWFAADGDRRLVIRSGADDPKLARVRRNPWVSVAACTFRGRPLGPAMRARARILPAEAEDDAELLLKHALGQPRALYNVLRAPLLPMAFIEVSAQ
jgi:PPOX class probable F420-dependent enzyme